MILINHDWALGVEPCIASALNPRNQLDIKPKNSPRDLPLQFCSAGTMAGLDDLRCGGWRAVNRCSLPSDCTLEIQRTSERAAHFWPARCISSPRRRSLAVAQALRKGQFAPRFDNAHNCAYPTRAPSLSAPVDCNLDVFTQLPENHATAHSAVAFGNFDGVHLGHRALLAQLVAHAKSLAGPAIAITFDPHPLAVLRPDRTPLAVDTLDARLRLLRDQGVDRTLVLCFNAAFASQSADWFARTVLRDILGARAITVGPDTRFGQGGGGDVALLREVMVECHGIVDIFDGVELGGALVSSSRVRTAVQAGDVALAARLLDRPFTLRGTVVHGDARGRQIGFPTANLQPENQVIPRNGVYACRVAIDGVTCNAVANLGVRPTFEGHTLRIEAHVLDFDGDLYGRSLELAFVARLRDEQRFDGVPALVAQLARDVAAARVQLGQPISA